MFGLIVPLAVQVVAQTTSSAPADSDAAAASQWSFSLVTSGYLVPHDQSYASPTFTADYRWLHLKARYNYEYQKAGSVWAGYNFSVGDKLVLEVTPMLGAVFGWTDLPSFSPLASYFERLAPGHQFPSLTRA
jgi:hypothetical protein